MFPKNVNVNLTNPISVGEKYTIRTSSLFAITTARPLQSHFGVWNTWKTLPLGYGEAERVERTSNLPPTFSEKFVDDKLLTKIWSCFVTMYSFPPRVTSASEREDVHSKKCRQCDLRLN